MKKTTLIAMVVLLIMAFSVSAWAAPAKDTIQAYGSGYCAPYYDQYYNNLTDDQKEQIADLQKQMLDQRKQILKKQVEKSYITQAQADQQIAWMEQQIANDSYGYGSMGMGGMRGGMGCW